MALAERLRRFASMIAAVSFAVVFALFILGVFMRYVMGRPLSWIDEAVTILSVWSTFWTAAFVLRWPDHISFDIVYANINPVLKRLFLIVGLTGFIALMAAAMPGMVDYTLFLWRERTDSMQMRLDWVYSVFPAFFAIVLLRMAYSLWRLASGTWRSEVAAWDGATESEPSP
jgi:TRAP-type C4-dicarboxylate transport system permease small subunit